MRIKRGADDDTPFEALKIGFRMRRNPKEHERAHGSPAQFEAMKHFSKKAGILFLLTALLAAFLYALPLHGEGEIYQKVLRLHVIANSDSEEDQALKLKVRDTVLSLVAECTSELKTREEAESAVSSRLEELRAAAEETLRENGCPLPVSVSLGREAYPTREYEDLRLPAGIYSSLRVKIGEAEGKNWWCVLFPPLCTGTATAREELVQAGFTPGQVRVLTDSESPEYVLRFKILEFFGSLFS